MKPQQVKNPHPETLGSAGWQCPRPHCTSTKHHAQGHCQRCYEKRFRSGLLKPRRTYIDPEPVRARIVEHQRRGRSLQDLATVAGVDLSGLIRITTNKRRNVTTHIAARIYAVALPPTDIGTLRRIQALSRLGHTWESIATEAGVTLPALANGIVRGRFGAWLSVPVAEVFERWSLRIGPSRRARLRAQRNGWPAPVAWHGVDIDDPAAVPDLGSDTRVTAADKAAEIEHLTSLGVPHAMACQQVGIKPATLTSIRWRAAAREAAA